MKAGSPMSRKKLSIKKNYSVLDIGCGPFPHPRANVVVDKYVHDNTHRSDDVKFLKNQKFIEADGEDMPFSDNEFDYAICSHVLEHVENPEKFVKEISRVAKRGYLETPSLLGEYLAPKASHKWLILDIDGTIVMYEKGLVGFNVSQDFGHVFLDYFPKKSIGWKLLQRTQTPIMTMNYEWEGSIDILVNPKDESLKKYFMETWSLEMANTIFTERSLKNEFVNSLSAFKEIASNVYKSKVLKR